MVIKFVVESVRFEQNSVGSKIADELNLEYWNPICLFRRLFVVRGTKTDVLSYQRTVGGHKSVLEVLVPILGRPLYVCI